MKKFMIIILACLAILLILATITQPLLGIETFRYIPGYKWLVTQYTKSTCYGSNKEFHIVGFSASPICTTKFPDGGKPCQNAQECSSGHCVAQLPSAPYCKRNSLDNCWGGEVEIQDGKPTGPTLICD